MKKIRLLLYFLIFFFTTKVGSAQDPEFSQFYAAPVYLNPAYAGTTFNPKIHLNFRDQWPALAHAYVSYAVSYDQYIEALHGGIGVVLLGDRAGGGIYQSIQAAAIYSYQLNISDKFAIKAGFQGTFIQKRLDLTKVFFYDQIDPIGGFYSASNILNPSGEVLPADPTVNLFDVSTGILAYSEHIFGGLAVKHLTQPEENFIEGTGSQLPLRFTLHGGAVLNFGGKNRGNATFSPNFMYTQQASFRQLNVGSYLKKEFIFGGAWFRYNISNADAVILLIGVQEGVFKLGYSYDLTLSSLGSNTGGSHEVSITLDFDELPDAGGGRKSNEYLKCPKIF